MAQADSTILTWRGVTIQRFPAHYSYVYLIHFNEPYLHAKNYLGSTSALDSRLRAHRNGNGARLMEVVTDAGIEWEVARLWRCDTYEEAHALEKKLKKQHRPLLCPLCNPRRARDPLVGLLHGHFPFALFDASARVRTRSCRSGRRAPMHAPTRYFP